MEPNLKDRLAELRQYLKALPSNIPVPKESKYNFSNFSLDADWTAEIGEAAAVKRELEVRSGSRAGGLKIVERGPETEAVVDVLETWTRSDSSMMLLYLQISDHLRKVLSFMDKSGYAMEHQKWLLRSNGAICMQPSSVTNNLRSQRLFHHLSDHL
ncbi:hypothetical protein F4604DRAFT_2038550 [Suillus subluteus]|nr:hypothetical protein F4604DRAFT_2038550 [Suillus subluteus]